MILQYKSAMDDQIIHLTEDNMRSLRNEIREVRGALVTKFPQEDFPRILPILNPDGVLPPKEAQFELMLGPDPATNIYGDYGCTLRADRIPYSFFVAKWIGIQVDVETPFIEELLLWVQRMNNHEDVPCRNSQWRHQFFQKRRLLLKQKLGTMLQKEIMDLIMITQHFKNGSLEKETGFFAFYAALVQRKLLMYEDE